MASPRNVKILSSPGTGGGMGMRSGPFDPTDKLKSNTLKRHPKMDLNKSDLLRLLSYLEGELQARDISIATLKAEKAKQLLFQAKYGRFGLGDPFMALQRDSDNLKDNSFDEMAVKTMYDNQLAQLENLIATQRKGQQKMREQLSSGEKRYYKACSELDEERQKHAQDTAQGDDVAYMLEKERERLRQEIDFEKTEKKKVEKEYKKAQNVFDGEKNSSAKHKQVALLLIKERKKLIEKILFERQKCSDMELRLSGEKGKTKNMAEGLVQESTKSLKMEAAMEKQLSEFDVEREQLKNKLSKEENKNKELNSQVESLKQQVEYYQKHFSKERSSKDYLQGIEIKSSASPVKTTSRERSVEHIVPVSPTVSTVKLQPQPKSVVNVTKDMADHTRQTIRENATVGTVASTSPTEKVPSSYSTVVYGDGRVSPGFIMRPEKTGMEPSVSASHVSVAHVPPTGSGKVTVKATASTGSPRKQSVPSRGTPPPIPPNKPILSAALPSQKPAPPPKVGIAMSRDKTSVSASDILDSGASRSRTIPIKLDNSATSRTPPRENSPMRKPQVCVNAK